MTTPSSTDLWRDWSPGYDGAVGRGAGEGVHRRPRAHRGGDQLLPRHVGPDAAGARAGRRAGGGVAADAEADAVPARPRRRLHAARRRWGRRSTSWPRARPSRSSTTPATSCTWNGPMSSTGHIIEFLADFLIAASSVRPQRSRRTGSFPPDHAAKPSATTAAATRSARAGSSGQPHGAGEPAPAHGAVAERLEQPPPALAVRPGEGALRARRGAEPPRVDVGRQPVAAPARIGAAAGSAAQSGRAAVHTVAPRSNMAWLNSHDRPAGTSRSPNAMASRTVSGGARHGTGQDTHAVGVDGGHVVPEGEGAHGPRRVRPDAGQGAQGRVVVRDARRRGRPPWRRPPGAGSAPGGCSRARTTGGPPPPVPRRAQAAGVGKAARKRS